MSWNLFWYTVLKKWQGSRSTWACELKFIIPYLFSFLRRHAPRERVSWNSQINQLQKTLLVTLHVSVWVEIVCEQEIKGFFKVTLHVSVWVEIKIWLIKFRSLQSRSTWACELKCNIFTIYCLSLSVTLHVSVWVEICEKFHKNCKYSGHAPRERVSWNSIICCDVVTPIVTLHVSVWVEIYVIGKISLYQLVTLHVSVWVEMYTVLLNCPLDKSRSTWACELKSSMSHNVTLRQYVTLHVSVWVEMENLHAIL